MTERITRRQFLILTAVTTGGILLSGCDFRKEPEGLYDLKPAPEVDRMLLKKLLDIEAKYTQDNLLGSVRQNHLELSAEVFAQLAGEQMPKDDLVKSVHWLTPEEYAKTSAPSTSAAHTVEQTGEVRINTHARLLSNQLTNTMKRSGFPYWSALTTARAFIYQHEWYHKAGVTNKRLPDRPVDLSKYYQHPLMLSHTYGFSIRTKNPDKEEYDTDNALEEAFAYLMNSRLEKQLTGSDIKIERSEHIVGLAAEATNRGRQRFEELFKRKPEWIKDFQTFHRESDPFGFGRFLVDNTNYLFRDEQQKQQYSMDLLMAFTLSPSEAPFRDYLTHLR